MPLPDRNIIELRSHEAKQDAREKTYDALLPEAEQYLRDWVRDGEDIGKPARFKKLSPFLLADLILDDGDYLDAEFIANLITLRFKSDYIIDQAKRIGDRAFEVWVLTPAAEYARQDIITWLEESDDE